MEAKLKLTADKAIQEAAGVTFHRGEKPIFFDAVLGRELTTGAS